jgi:hypothetical protein
MVAGRDTTHQRVVRRKTPLYDVLYILIKPRQRSTSRKACIMYTQPQAFLESDHD